MQCPVSKQYNNKHVIHYKVLHERRNKCVVPVDTALNGLSNLGKIHNSTSSVDKTR